MKTWFECSIRYEKTMEDGMQKKVTEKYLVDAMSFTEAEARIIEEMSPFISGEFKVTAIKITNLSEVFASNMAEDEKWYKLKVAFITLDEKSGKEKKAYQNMLVQSCSTNDAEKDLNEFMKGTMSDYEIAEVVETQVMDVFFYEEEKETEENR